MAGGGRGDGGAAGGETTPNVATITFLPLLPLSPPSPAGQARGMGRASGARRCLPGWKERGGAVVFTQVGEWKYPGMLKCWEEA